MTKQVKLDEIRIDGGTQWRKVIDQEMVYHYLDCMKNGDVFPPIETVFDGVTHWLVDGFHRYHAYKLLNLKTVEVISQQGTQQEAQVISFGVNGKHGKQRTREEKEAIVRAACAHELTKDLTDKKIAEICDVSRPFVGAIRRPEVKEKQKENRIKHAKKVAKQEEAGNPITKIEAGNPITAEVPVSGDEPDEAELLANQKKHEADLEMLGKFLDADDKMAHLHEENKRLNHLVVMKDLRIKELMNEKSAAVKMVKDLQKQLDKLKAKK